MVFTSSESARSTLIVFAGGGSGASGDNECVRAGAGGAAAASERVNPQFALAF